MYSSGTMASEETHQLCQITKIPRCNTIEDMIKIVTKHAKVIWTKKLKNKE